MILASHGIAGTVLVIAMTMIQAAPVHAGEPSFRFPAEVAGFARGTAIAAAREAGEGVPMPYADGRWKASIQVFLALNATSPEIEKRLRHMSDVIRAEAHRDQDDLVDRGTVRLARFRGEQLACRALATTSLDLGSTERLLCATGLHGHIVTFAFSGSTGRAPLDEADRFITRWFERQ